jgi:glycosyltransferase involved in cell wall biosynthesis
MHRVNDAERPAQVTPAADQASPRVVACCGQMVINGGLERMTYEILRAVNQSGGASHAIVNGWENFRITPEVEACGSSWSVGPYYYTLRRRQLTPIAVAKMVFEVARVSADLIRVSRRFRPTHVFVPDFVVVLRNAPALTWLRLRGVIVILSLQNAPSPGPFYRHLWARVINSFVDRLVANSDFTRREHIALGIPAEKIQTITNMAPRRELLPRPFDRIPGRVIFVGQIIPGKGVHLLLEAIALLRARGLDATLDVVGDMDGWEAPEFAGYRASLRARVAQPDLAGGAVLLGQREDIPGLMGRASVHCCPSLPDLREAFGIVVLEAKLASIPSVVTPSGNLPDLVRHRVDGWACTRADAESIAEALEFFLRLSPAESAEAGRAARASADRYHPDVFDAAWTGVFTGSEKKRAV